MHKKNFRRIVLLFAVLFPVFSYSQKQISAGFDVGENNISEGLFVKSLVQGVFQFGKNRAEGGMQLELKSTNENAISGYYLKYSRQFSLKNFPFELQCLYLRNKYSDVLYESDFGTMIEIKRKHFSYRLGAGFRTYGYTKYAIDEYGIEGKEKIHESWNVVYLLDYDLKPEENKWNIGLALTNIDRFLVNQESNPFCNLHGRFRLSGSLSLVAEMCYKSAGNFNLCANYFGFFCRTGIIWKIE